MPDLADLLKDSARRPRADVDPQALLHRGRRRERHVRYAAAIGAAVVITVGGAALMSVRTDDPSRILFEPPTSAPSEPAATELAPPSQTSRDAQRDGVVPDIAALPFRVRVDATRNADGAQRVVTEEGIWIVSRLSPKARRYTTGGSIIGDPNGRRHIDAENAFEYGEILLLNRTGTRIKRAFPFGGYPPSSLAVTDNAVYCSRQGDGALPNSMVARIDRNTFDTTVRVFVADAAYGSEWSGWIIDQAPGDPMFSVITSNNGTLTVRSDTGASGTIDPTSLQLLHR